MSDNYRAGVGIVARMKRCGRCGQWYPWYHSRHWNCPALEQ